MRTAIAVLLFAASSLALCAADFRPTYVTANQAYQLHQWDIALQRYLEAEQIDPTSGYPVWGEANCLYLLGRKSEALTAYRRASKLLPGSSYLSTRVRSIEADLWPTQAQHIRPTSTSTTAQGEQLGFFGLGVGYPDIRARLNIWRSMDVEAKAAIGSAEQAYSGRVFMRPFDLGPLAFEGGVEAGYLKFNVQDSLAGDGMFAEPFVGLEYGFSRRWRVNADIGPAWIKVVSSGQSLSELQWTYNTAIYFFIF